MKTHEDKWVEYDEKVYSKKPNRAGVYIIAKIANGAYKLDTWSKFNTLPKEVQSKVSK